MSNTMNIKMTCPYCEAEWWTYVEEGVQLIICPEDVFENACGEHFVIDVSFRAAYKSFKLVEEDKKCTQSQ